MKITQGGLNRYRNQISQRKSDASAYLRARMAKEIKGLSIADARNKTIEIMQDCLAVFGDQAQALSAELSMRYARRRNLMLYLRFSMMLSMKRR